MKLQLCVGALASSAEPSTRAAAGRGARLAASLSAHTHAPLPIPQHVSTSAGLFSSSRSPRSLRKTQPLFVCFLTPKFSFSRVVQPVC